MVLIIYRWPDISAEMLKNECQMLFNHLIIGENAFNKNPMDRLDRAIASLHRANSCAFRYILPLDVTEAQKQHYQINCTITLCYSPRLAIQTHGSSSGASDQCDFCQCIRGRLKKRSRWCTCCFIGRSPSCSSYTKSQIVHAFIFDYYIYFFSYFVI